MNSAKGDGASDNKANITMRQAKSESLCDDNFHNIHNDFGKATN